MKRNEEKTSTTTATRPTQKQHTTQGARHDSIKREKWNHHIVQNLVPFMDRRTKKESF